ncbi:hypothetical protein DIZ81_13125 [Legionella taurinensis]|uniref:ATP-grasp domain-containing protein n=1 Tax=Legionella taurinensis TaxID=70611 RepID=A0A3A5LAL1_9GAMM|nr:hypothetical protein [Legionella taurinensis]MDX1836007.1 hypothetical protein [Legionella taurinensis]PUT38716.1 hypothetical protein DB744_13135 [Legionella taurinensis]PUT40095.1 hypothetical protein DB746_12535 [Legionella taurinensis]PUT42247.1 hypothetical protein DB743_13020 [Legionella taurinensis]PUT46019.1 hypothetical protein DB745_11990 [Legionella taurinensis]
MKFLILTEPDDSHAMCVKLALEKTGHDVRLLFTADLPTKQKNSVYIDNVSYEWKSTDAELCVRDNYYDVVWWRRARKPFLPREAVHPDDYHFVLRENILFHESITHNLAPKAWWVNSKEAALRANSKLLQLKWAVQCGLTIPSTLCSNDPKDIRYFLLKHEDQGVIYKPLCSNVWFEERALKIAYTAKVAFLDLPSNQLLQLAPGLFQKEVKKKYELRVTCFGDYLVAAKLNSQQHDEGRIDWRAIPEGQLTIEPYSLPTEIENRIRHLMKKMGLVFGCIDFIVSTDDQYVFLEVNEQGQFLWIEDLNPAFPMLDLFVQFLTNQSVHFVPASQPPRHWVTDYEREAGEWMERSRRQHVEINALKTNQGQRQHA